MNTEVRTLGGGVAALSHEEHGHSGGEAPLDERPRSVYEMLTRRMLEELRGDLDEIKGRVNALLWLTVGAVLIDLVMRMVK